MSIEKKLLADELEKMGVETGHKKKGKNNLDKEPKGMIGPGEERESKVIYGEITVEDKSDKEEQEGLLEAAHSLGIDLNKLAEYLRSDEFKGSFDKWDESQSLRKEGEEKKDMDTEIEEVRDSISPNFFEFSTDELSKKHQEIPHPINENFVSYLEENYGLEKSPYSAEELSRRAEENGVKVVLDAETAKWPPKNMVVSSDNKIFYLEGYSPKDLKLIFFG